MKNNIVFFDGVCNLCNGWVKFLKKYDRKKRFEMYSLQSQMATSFLAPQYLSAQPESIIYLRNGKIFTKSLAVCFIFKDLPLPFSLLYALRIIPPFIRDSVYKWVAKNRYRWFGKCPLEGL
jgi:predicted DCC family thiol-disulfide oxidoreductase YuxK